MAQRYISASERASALAQGLTRLARLLDSPDRHNAHKDAWNEWCKVWGPKMKDRVMEIHEQNMIWAINYQD